MPHHDDQAREPTRDEALLAVAGRQIADTRSELPTRTGKSVPPLPLDGRSRLAATRRISMFCDRRHTQLDSMSGKLLALDSHDVPAALSSDRPTAGGIHSNSPRRSTPPRPAADSGEAHRMRLGPVERMVDISEVPLRERTPG